MTHERLRKSERTHHHPKLFSLFRTMNKRSKSLDNLSERTHRKEGKIKICYLIDITRLTPPPSLPMTFLRETDFVGVHILLFFS